jgi:hypothetical protein
MECRQQRHHARTAIALVLSASLVSATFAGAGTLPPRREDALLRWLREGRYRDAYVAEPALHPSVSAHGMSVRTYFSPRLVADLSSGRSKFRKGAAMVKELYFGGGEVVGWSVMRKLQRRSRGGRSWLFYETFDGTAQSAIFGRGVAICVGCHQEGADFLLSPFRP